MYDVIKGLGHKSLIRDAVQIPTGLISDIYLSQVFLSVNWPLKGQKLA